MTIRSLSTDLTNSLLTDNADYRDNFSYAHIVKFEKAIKTTTGEPRTDALAYAYITDGSRDISFDDQSGNGAQRYLSNRLISVGSVTETTQARASSISLQIDATALSTSLGDTFTLGADFIQSNFDLVLAGFAEGDKVQLIDVGDDNDGKTARIDSFTQNNTRAIVTVDEAFVTKTNFYTLEFASEEVIGLLNKRTATSYAGYINREVFIYKAHIDNTNGLIIGSPYLLFKGIINNAKLTENPEGNSKISWNVSSHWGDFVRVSGRLTSDSFHRGLDASGRVIPSALKRQEYATDLGFAHSELAINLIAIYQVKETRTKLKMKRKWYGSKKYKQVEYQVNVDREADLRFNLEAKYLPVVYGVQKIDSVPFFVDTESDNSRIVYVAYAICEGEISGIYDIYLNNLSSICVDGQDSVTRGPTATENVDVACIGRMDQGDVLGTTTSVYDGTKINAKVGKDGEPRSVVTVHTTELGEFVEYDDGVYAVNLDNVEALSATGTVTNGNGIQEGEFASYTSPIDARFTFHAGASNQKADSLLVSLASAGRFKLQQDYYSDKKFSYWGGQHRVLDTAYVVGKYTIGEDETSIPELDFVVRGRLINCYNYDWSYLSVPASGQDVANFILGEEVTLHELGGTQIGSSNYIQDIFTLPENTSSRVRLKNDPGFTTTSSFYIKSVTTPANQLNFIVSGATEITGIVDETLEAPIQSVAAGTTTGAVNVTVSSGAVPRVIIESAAAEQTQPDNSLKGRGAVTVIAQKQTQDTQPEDGQGGPGSEDKGDTQDNGNGTHTIEDYVTSDSATEFDTVLNYITINNAIALDPSTASSTEDAYNGFEIEVTRTVADGSTYIQKRKVVKYYAFTEASTDYRIAAVDSAFDIGYLPTGNGVTGDSYKLYTKPDLRVSINPVMQTLDYMTNVRFGKGLSLEKDIGLPSFLAAARVCDTRSDVSTISTSYSPVVGGIYKYSYNGKTVWQGTKLSSKSESGLLETVWTDVVGKLGYKWHDWKTYAADDLVWTSGALYRVPSAGKISKAALETQSNLVNSPLTLTNVNGPSFGNASMTIEVGNAPGEYSNPVIKKLQGSTTTFASGYSLYDSDEVKFWKYLGWADQNQREVTRHQTNVVLDTSASVFDNINSMLNHFNGMLRYSNGKYDIAVESKVGTLDSAEILYEDDIIGTINVEDAGQKGTFNLVSVGISDPQNSFETRNISFFNSTYLKEDRNVSKKGDFKTPYVTNYYNARINASQYLEQSRYGLKISFKTTPRGILLVAGNIIAINYDRFGWVTKYFRITNLTFTNDCLVQVTAEEHNDDAYLVQPSPVSEFSGQTSASVSNQADVVTPTSFSHTTQRVGIQLSWVNAPKFNPNNYTIEIKRNTTNNVNTAELIGTSSATTYLDPVISIAPTTLYYWIRYRTTSTTTRSTENIPKTFFSPYTSALTAVTASGVEAVSVNLSKPVVALSENPLSLGSYVYTGTGTAIRVKSGITDIPYDSTGAAEPSFKVNAVTPTNITAGAVDTEGSDFILYAVPSSITALSATIKYSVQVTDSFGNTSLFYPEQDFSVSSVGSRGAGRWHVPVTSLPTTSSQADTAWDTSWTNRPGDPIAKDQAWFFVGSESAPTAQSVWIYDPISSWVEQTEAVDGSLLIDETISTDKIGANQITADLIAANQITANQIAANQITANQIAANSITADQIAANQITANQIAANQITATLIAANQINTNLISSNTIIAKHVSAASVVSALLDVQLILADQIAANAITTDKLAANSITANQIAANQITADLIAANSITAAQITANSITSAAIAANSITSSMVSSNSIVSNILDSNTITAVDITVTELSAFTANLGNITAGTMKNTGANAIPDANSAPSGSEAGAHIDLDNGRFVFGNASQHILWDGADLVLSGVTIDEDSIVNAASGIPFIQDSGTQEGTNVPTLNFGTNLSLSVTGTSPDFVATIDGLSDSGIRGLFSGGTGITYTSSTGNIALTNSSLTVNSNTVALGSSITLVTDDIAEDGSPTNLWFTNTRAQAAITAGNGLTKSVGTLNVGAGTGISVAADTVGLAAAGVGAGTYGSTDNATKIDTITVDAYGRVTAVATGATGDIDGVTAGTGLTGGGTSGTPTLNVIGGDGITANADNITVDSTVVRTSGTQTIGGAKTFSNNIVIQGDLTVSGTTTTINTETVNIADNIILLNSNFTGSSPTESAGIEVERGTQANVLFQYKESGVGTTGDLAAGWSVGTSRLEATGFYGTFYGDGSNMTGVDADSLTGLSTADLAEDPSATVTSQTMYYTNARAQAAITAGNGLTKSVGTLNVGAGTGISVAADTVGLAAAGVGAGTYGSTDNATKIDTITVDAYGRVTAVATGATGDIDGVTAGTGLTGGGTSGTPTLNVGAGSGISVAADSVAVDGTVLRTSTNFAGDVSGAYNAIVVANDSHTHDTRYYTETESDGRYVRSNATNTTAGIRFQSQNVLDSASGTQASLEVFQDQAGEDAFMAFHVGGDYALYFGLDGASNDLAVGGWSMGAVKYKVWHAGNHGIGSGLNADLLDGQHGSYYYPASNPSGYTSHAAANNASITLGAGTGINITPNNVFTTNQSSNETINIDINLNELATSTTDGDGDYFVVVDTAGTGRKLTKGNIALSGFNDNISSTSASVNTLVKRNASGYIFSNYINTTDDVSATLGYLVGKQGGTDNYHRSYSAATVRAFLNVADGANNYSFPYTIDTGASANTVVRRQANGYIFAVYYNGTGTFSTSGDASGMGLFTGTNGSDTYGRSYTAAAARTLLNVANGANNYSLPTNNVTNASVSGNTLTLSRQGTTSVAFTATSYSLPAATASVRGGVKTGTASTTGLQMSGDTIQLAATGSFVLNALSVNTINANKITANTITATQMAADSITAGQLAISKPTASTGIYFSTTAIEIRDSSNTLRVKIGLL